MPVYSHHTFEDGGIAIWRIEENSDTLYAMLDTSRYNSTLKSISHEARRAEWLAVRVLITEVLGNDKEIAYLPSGRPYLVDGSYHISISHTKGYAAIAYHRIRSIGIDIEHISPRVNRIAHRFTHPDEAAFIDIHDTERQLMYHLVNWSAKEALYKLIDDPTAADFHEVFRISPYTLAQQGILAASFTTKNSLHTIFYKLHTEFVCTWVLSIED